jgi:anti-anti-sigma factor
MTDSADPSNNDSSHSGPAADRAMLVVLHAVDGEPDDRCTRIALRGALDLDGVQAIDASFTAAVLARHRATIVDGSQLTFLSSLGISLLVSAGRTLRSRQKPLVLCELRPEIESMLRALRLETLMTIVATRADAEALVARVG